MFIDREGRLFGKVSIVDILIVLVIIAAIAFVGYKYSTAKVATPFTKSDDIKVVFFCNEMPDFVVDSLKTGEIAKDTIKGNEFGKAVNIETGPSKSDAMTDKGEFILTSKPGYKSVTITVEGKGLFGSSGVTIGNSEYYVGSQINFKVGNTALFGKIYSISKKE